MGGTEKNYVRQVFVAEACALGGGQTGNFRAKKNNLFWELDTKNAGMPAFSYHINNRDHSAITTRFLPLVLA